MCFVKRTLIHWKPRLILLIISSMYRVPTQEYRTQKIALSAQVSMDAPKTVISMPTETRKPSIAWLCGSLRLSLEHPKNPLGAGLTRFHTL